MILNGIPTAQTEEQIGALHLLIKQYKVSLFIELGAFMGGLTYELMKLKSDDFRVLSIQLDFSELHEKVRGCKEIICGDVFSQRINDVIKEAIQTTNGVAMVFCDNGNKPKEFETYYPLLRSGDLIQVHDYPGEITKGQCDLISAYPDLIEIKPEYYRSIGTVIWEKI